MSQPKVEKGDPQNPIKHTRRDLDESKLSSCVFQPIVKKGRDFCFMFKNRTCLSKFNGSST